MPSLQKIQAAHDYLDNLPLQHQRILTDVIVEFGGDADHGKTVLKWAEEVKQRIERESHVQSSESH